MKRRLILFLLGGLVVMTVSVVVVQAQRAPEPAQTTAQALVERRVKNLGPLPLPPAAEIYFIIISPNGERLAYTLRDRSRRGKPGPRGYQPSLSQSCVVCDGKPGPFYDSVESPGFSPDSKRLAYRAFEADPGGPESSKSCVVCDGKELDRKYAYGPGPVFSPDSKHLAYQGSLEAKDEAGNRPSVLLIDGREVFTGRGTKTPLFSPDSQHWATMTTTQPTVRALIVCDGEIGPSYNGVWGERPVFSPDSKQLAYGAVHKGRHFVVVAALHQDKWVVVRDWKDGPTHDGALECPVFSPDGQHLAYVGMDGGKASVWLDGKKLEASYDLISGPFFSSDSKRLAYKAVRGTEVLVVCDGKEGPRYDRIDGPCVFSPDSKHLAYFAWRGTKGPEPAKWRGAKWFVVCDGREGPPVAYKDPGRFLPQGDWPKKPVFSPDSKHLAYRVVRDMEQFIVIDGIAGPAHAIVRTPEKYCLVDGKVIEPGVDPAPPDKNGKLRYVVGDGKEAWLVEVDWPKDLDWTNGMKTVEP